MSYNHIQSSRNSSGTAENKFILLHKSWDFSPNTRGESRSLFLFDDFYVLTDFIVSQFWVSWLWQQSVCSDLSAVFPSVQAVINGCMLIVFSHRGQTEPLPALQHKQRIPPINSSHTNQKSGPGLRSDRDSDRVDRGNVCVCVSVTEFPIGRSPSQLNITLAGGQNTNHSRDSL